MIAHMKRSRIARIALWITLGPCFAGGVTVVHAQERACTTAETRQAALAVRDTPVSSEGTREARLAANRVRLNAALVLGDGAFMRRALEERVALADGAADGAEARLELARSEYVAGGQRRAIAIVDEVVDLADVPPVLRAEAAALAAYWRLDTAQFEQGRRPIERAETLHRALGEGIDPAQRARADASMSQARAQWALVRGDLDRYLEEARRAAAFARDRYRRVLAANSSDVCAPAAQLAVSSLDAANGMLVFALVRTGHTAEALSIAQGALARGAGGRYGGNALAGMQMRIARVHNARGHHAEALKATRDGLAALRSAGGEATSQRAAILHREETLALVGLERWADADAAYKAFIASVRSDAAALARTADPRLMAVLAAKNGRLPEALETIERNVRQRTAIYGADHAFTRDARGVRGMVHLLRGDATAAVADFDAYFAAFLDDAAVGRDSEVTAGRSQYAPTVNTEFLRYVAGQLGATRRLDPRSTDRLVQLTDRLSTGSTRQAIADSTARFLAGNPELAALVRAEQEERADLTATYGRITSSLLRLNDAALPPDDRAGLRAEVAKLQGEVTRRNARLAESGKALLARYPEYAALVNPAPPVVAAVRAALDPGETFVMLFPSAVGTFAWAVPQAGEPVVHLAAWREADVRARVHRFRTVLDIGSAPAGAVPEFDFALAHELYRELFAPLAPALKEARTLIVAAHGALATVPFGALLTAPGTELGSAPWLARSASIAQVPSPSAFVALRRAGRAAQAAPASLVGFGDPQFDAAAPAEPAKVRRLVTGEIALRAASYDAERGFEYRSIPPLPDTRDELIAIAKALGADPERDLYLGARATRRAVLTTDIASRRVVAFATHGLIPGDIPGLSKPALAMAATGQNGESPLLTLDDVLSLRLNSQWVVLSACNTAAGERDGEAMSGLVRGFFFAGTRSVLATHWAVDSAASQLLVTEIFGDAARDTRRSRAESVQAGQLALIGGKGNPAYAHPFFWAPYALFGDPSR